MNSYIPVLEQQPPPGFICNVRWTHIGPQKVNGHTPPRVMDIVCPCVECFAEMVCSHNKDIDIDRVVLGPVWFGHNEPEADIAEYVGIYDLASMENK